MIRIKRPARIAALVLLAAALLGALWFQSIRIHRMFKQVYRPALEHRQLAEPRIHSWMTVEEIAQRCQVPIERVFSALGISAQPGDEKLPIKKLEEKYGLSRDEVRRGLDSLHNGAASPPGPES